jgi:hypothetical protein
LGTGSSTAVAILIDGVQLLSLAVPARKHGSRALGNNNFERNERNDKKFFIIRM